MTILEKVGLTAAMVAELKREGLIVPPKVEPFAKALRTPGDRLYSSDDIFTPPLSEEERELYIGNPKLFCRDLIERLVFFSKVSGLLFEASGQIDKKLGDREALAAYVAVLYVFHACGDYNCYKYCKHLDYYEYEQSPVGYYYKKLKGFCFDAAQKRGIRNPGEWSVKKLLELISSPVRKQVGKVGEYELICKQIFGKLSRMFAACEELSPEGLLERIKDESADFYKELLDKSGYFFKLPSEFISDCIDKGKAGLDPESKIRVAKQVAKKAYFEVSGELSEEGKEEFTKTLDIIQDFILVHQEEGFIFNGITPSGSHLLDVFFTAYNKIKEIIKGHPEFVSERYKDEAKQILDEKNPVVGARRIVQMGGDFLEREVQQLYSEELQRWL